MINKTPLLLLLIFMYHGASSQKKRTLLKGIVYNTASTPIENTHIVNLTTMTGTISNKSGVFTLMVNKGDWIQVSNIQFRTKKIKLKKGTLKEGVLSVYLIPVTNVLEEAVIKKKLTGVLALDRSDKKKDTIPKIDKKYYNFSKMDLSIKTPLYKPLDSEKLADPTMNNAPITIFKVEFGGSSKKKQAQRNEINFMENFPQKLKNELGENFFFVKLKIPKERYFHFLQYCSPFDIEQLFKDQKRLEILKILLKESKSYLLLLENNK